MKSHTIAAFLDELEKIGGRMQSAGYMQTRRGTRPYRVDTLLGRSSQPSQPVQPPEPVQDARAPEVDQPLPAEPVTADGAEPQEAAVGKLAAAEPTMTEKAMAGMSQARPYVVGGIKAAIPAAFFAKIMAGEGAKGSHAARVAGLAGAGLGVANEYMKQWAEKNKRQELAKKILSSEKR